MALFDHVPKQQQEMGCGPRSVENEEARRDNGKEKVETVGIKGDAKPDQTEESGMLQGRANQNGPCQSCDQAYLLAIGK